MANTNTADRISNELVAHPTAWPGAIKLALRMESIEELYAKVLTEKLKLTAGQIK